MLSSVQSRPNYYQMLGLTPAATDAQVNEAFAKTMSLLPPPGAAAQVCIAYETLRNPVRRRDYDLSLGLTAPARAQPSHLTIPVAQQRWTPFVASARAEPSKEATTSAEPHVTSTSPAQSEQSRQPTAVATEAMVPAPRPLSEQLPFRREEPRSPVVAAAARPQRPLQSYAEPRFAHGEARQSAFSRTGLAIGAVVVGVVVLGAWAGTIAGNDVESAQAEQVAGKTLQKPKPTHANIVSTDVAPGPVVVPQAAPRKDIRWRRNDYQLEAQRTSSSGLAEHDLGQSSAKETDTAAAPEVSAAANIPLPDKVIARTIDRIGYRCGDVASTTSVARQPGVYTVSCTSGRSFQATPVGGRYRFRRVG